MFLERISAISQQRGGGGRKRLRAVGILAAVAGLTALTACGSSSSTSGGQLSGISGGGIYGTVPAQSGTAHAGLLKVGIEGGSSPTWMLPIVTGAADSIYEVYWFSYEMDRPLYWFPTGFSQTEDKPMSLADDPVWSDGDTTASVTLKSGWKWSDGQPVTSQDVLFWYDEVKAAVKENAANWAAYTPGVGIPDQVASVDTPNSSTIVFHLKSAVNPTWFWQDELSSIQPMPAHAWAIDATGGKTLDFTSPANATKIYNYLTTQAKAVSTFASNPLWQVVDGPYKLTSFNATNGSYSFAPNTTYYGPHASVESPFEVLTYASDAAEYNALKSGALDVGYVPTDDVTQSKSLTSAYGVFGYPSYGFRFANYNFLDKTGDFDNIISQLYVRQALAHLYDQQGIITAYLHGAGATDYGVVGKYPSSPYTPADALTDPYPFDPTTAADILKAHGWSVVPNGTDTCTKPGTASDECGTGIPAGTKLSWNLFYTSEVPLTGQVVTDLASQARGVGIDITLVPEQFNTILSDYNDAANPAYDNKWAMTDLGGFSNSTYPTTFEIFNTGGSENAGGYSDAEANKLITASVTSSDPMAVKSELSYLTEQQPVLFQQQVDYAGTPGLVAVNKAISGPPASFESVTQDMLNPEFWYFKK
ncbi:MAG: ABC transporter substrate-binding protein [Streptosporangiaceae bacterium]|jgi:peptide/nickel transport system substrate-binding protein